MSVLRLDPKGDDEWELKRISSDVSRPNGILVSRDQKTLYVAQSGYSLDQARELRAYDINDDGTLDGYNTLHTFGVDRRGPQRGVDGMTLDAEGNIFVCAGWEEAGPGPMIYVFSPEGRVLSTHPLRVDRPTNCCFGGPDRSTLYLTSVNGHFFKAKTDMEGWALFP